MEVVGLKNFVDDDVNKLIAKFVGFKPHPLAQAFNDYFVKFERWVNDDDDLAAILNCEAIDPEKPEEDKMAFPSSFFDAMGMGIFEDGYFDEEESEEEN